VLFAAMFRRTIGLRDERSERLNRGYSRCGKFCGGILASPTPLVCSACAGKCICCAKSLAGVKDSGKLCKMCGIKRLSCARCGDKVGASQEPGYLCEGCGWEGRSDCCRMVYDVKGM